MGLDGLMTTPSTVFKSFGRRSFLVTALGILGSLGCTKQETLEQNPMAKVAPLVLPLEKWQGTQFLEFVTALPPKAIDDVWQAVGLPLKEASGVQLRDSVRDAMEIQRKLHLISSHVLLRPFGKARSFNYHETVSWVADRTGLKGRIVKEGTTFILERQLLELVFISYWEKLDVEGRKALLEKRGVGKQSDSVVISLHNDKAAIASIAAMTGASALAALSATVAFSGFAFYTTMSATIAAVAATVGVTLPFAAYAGASTVVGVLSGPIGWAIAGVAGLGVLAFSFGRSDVRTTALVIGKIHALKIEALKAADIPDETLKTALLLK